MKVKVCGLTTADQLKAVDSLGVDFLGLIFHAPSPRYVAKVLPSEVVRKLSLKATLTGVFVNKKPDEIIGKIDEYGLNAVQLCGNESPDDCKRLRETVLVLKVIHQGKDQPDMDYISGYEGSCDYFLFDTKAEVFGGSGKKFDWMKLTDANVRTPFLLSGGISENDVDAIRSFRHPEFAGVDINSRFEVAPGIKDIQKIKSFIAQINKI